jgi:ACS family tartrate transporter-like MFS transporter
MATIAGRTTLESALRKVQWRILPLLALCYLVAYMDRTNISFAAESMNRDLHFSAQVYGLGAGLFFVSYALCEIPSNRLLLRFGARRWLACILATWGVVAMAMMFVRTKPSFFGVRLLLGVAEAGFFPGALYYLSLWFPAARRARAISWFYMSLPLSSVVMGAAAGTLLRLDGRMGLHGWQWLFVVEGIPAVVLGLCLWFALADSPSEADWLNATERAELTAELKSERLPEENESTNLLLGRVLREPRVWWLSAFVFCIYGPVYGVAFFLPELVGKLMHLAPGKVGLLIAVAGLAGAAAMVLFAMSSDRTRDRRWHIMIPAGMTAGLLLFAGLNLHGPAAAFALLLTVPVYMAFQGPLMALLTEACTGKAAALAIATINMCGIFGGFVGPYWMGWMHDLTGGYAAGIGWMSVPWMAALGCVAWVTRPYRKVTSVDEKLLNATPELAE